MKFSPIRTLKVQSQQSKQLLRASKNSSSTKRFSVTAIATSSSTCCDACDAGNKVSVRRNIKLRKHAYYRVGENKLKQELD